MAGMMRLAAIAAMLMSAPAAAGEAPARVVRSTAPLAFLDGLWVGEATAYAPDGRAFPMKMMERVGPMLGGEVRVLEGKASDADGRTLFNAFSVVAPAAADAAYAMRSYTPGRTGAYELRMTGPSSFAWSYAHGGARFRYTAKVENGVWTEVGERLNADGSAARHFEMKLKRSDDTDWPAAGIDARAGE